MAVVFEFEVEKDFHFAAAFAERFKLPVCNDRVYLPDTLGEGFIQEVYLDNGLALCIHHYTLKQELVLKRIKTLSTDPLTIKFDCRRVSVKNNENRMPLFANNNGSEVEFGTGNFFSELTVPPGQPILFLVIGTMRQTLTNLVKLNGEGQWIEQTLKSNQSFLLHERMTHEMERTLKQLSQIDQATKLAALLYQAKALELIYLLFNKILSRTDSTSLTVNQADAEKIYEVRSTILNDLSITPQLPELAAKIGMSLTKMKQLFNQIFGKSIYNYYQAERMEQAAQLLNNFSVSETGYRVGFTNLSHFSRLFHKHHQIKPKRYKDTVSLN